MAFSPLPLDLVAIRTFFLTLKKVLFSLVVHPFSPPPPPLSGRATNKRIFFCDFLKYILNPGEHQWSGDGVVGIKDLQFEQSFSFSCKLDSRVSSSNLAAGTNGKPFIDSLSGCLVRTGQDNVVSQILRIKFKVR